MRKNKINKISKFCIMSKLKLLILMMVVLVTSVSCSCFVSDPVEPKILGVVDLQYDAERDLCYATVDSVQYTVVTVTVPDRNPRSYSKTQKLKPVAGMKVTIFISPKFTGVQAVLGDQDEDEIEAFYRENYIGLVIFFVIIAVFLIASVITTINEKKSECYGSWPWHFLKVRFINIKFKLFFNKSFFLKCVDICIKIYNIFIATMRESKNWMSCDKEFAAISLWKICVMFKSKLPFRNKGDPETL